MRLTAWSAISSSALLLVTAATAATAFSGRLSAQPVDFDAIAKGAKRVASGAAVRQLAWPFTGSCKEAAPGFDALQCEALKRRARVQAERTRYRVEVASSLSVKGDELTVHGCLECDGTDALVIGAGKVTRRGAVVLGPALVKVTRKTSAAVLARAHTEFVFSLDAAGRPVLVGFRAYDPCTGDVLAADPPSEDRNPSKTCKDAAAAAAE